MRKPKPKAVLWDVDGTMAETERDGHRVAFNLAFEARGLPWRWDEAHYIGLLGVSGGRERLLHDMAARPEQPASAAGRTLLAQQLHASKNAFYADIVRQARLPLRVGVLELLHECRDRGVRMGITTTTSGANVDALLRAHLGAQWSRGFAVLVCGEDVQRKKPDPEVYLRALRALDIGAHEAVAIEDSPVGVAAARAAEVPVIVTRSVCFAGASIDGSIAIGPGLHTRRGWTPALQRRGAAHDGKVGLDDLIEWRAQMADRSRQRCPKEQISSNAHKIDSCLPSNPESP